MSMVLGYSPIFTMAMPINPYAAPLLVHITESFKAAVNMMNKMSPSNSSAMTSSHKSNMHQFGQLALHLENSTKAALKDVH